MLAQSCSVTPAAAAKKFELVALGVVGHAEHPPPEVVQGCSHTWPACGATGFAAGLPGVPLFDHTRVNTTPMLDPGLETS
jgi:hypothetical protein